MEAVKAEANGYDVVGDVEVKKVEEEVEEEGEEEAEKDVRENKSGAGRAAKAKNPPSADTHTVTSRDEDIQKLLDALQVLYMNKLLPLEEASLFHLFHMDPITEAELQARPQVLLLGQYSVGKTTMVQHLIGRPFPNCNIGPEPSTDGFQVVIMGEEERIIKGTALAVMDELPFAGLRRFGTSFLNRFEASILPAEVLQHITFVDSPGVLAGEKQSIDRGYPFPAVAKWFADRSDLILVMFDAHKLDISDEFREVLDVVAGNTGKVRIILNKAQEVDADRLIKVYGALMWSISRSFRKKSELPPVFVGSWWSGNRRHPDSPPNDTTFDEDEAKLRKEMLDLPTNTGLRRINEVIKRARMLKVHICILDFLRREMPYLYGKAERKAQLIDNLEDVFKQVQARHLIPDGDMPELANYRLKLPSQDFASFLKVDATLLKRLDDIINSDIRSCVDSGGGIRRIYKVSSVAKIMKRRAVTKRKGNKYGVAFDGFEEEGEEDSAGEDDDEDGEGGGGGRGRGGSSSSSSGVRRRRKRLEDEEEDDDETVVRVGGLLLLLLLLALLVGAVLSSADALPRSVQEALGMLMPNSG